MRIVVAMSGGVDSSVAASLLNLGVALVLIAMVMGMNSLSIAFRMYLRGKKKW